MKPVQVAILQYLKKRFVLVHKKFTNEWNRITKLFFSHLNSRSDFNYYSNLIHSHFSNFQAETTIKEHTNGFSSIDLSKPLVVKGDGKKLPQNPP